MKRLYPNNIAIMGAMHVVFYDIEKQTYKRFSKMDLFDEPENNLGIFDLKQVNVKGIQLLKAQQLLIKDIKNAIDPLIKNSSFYKWKSPSLITNAIIELSEHNGLISPFVFSKLIHHLHALLCKHVFLHLKSVIAVDELKMLLELIHDSDVHSIQLALPYNVHYDTDELGSWIMELYKIGYVVFENAPWEKNLENKLFFTVRKLEQSSGKHPDQFVTNLFLFSESQLHHNYFNRKLFISEKGEIKNAPSCTEMQGTIQEIHESKQLINIVKTPAFRKLWYVSKERCEVCRDCEYRYMCVDDRLPRQRENGYWYHEQDCNYDPYTGKWTYIV